MGITLLTKEITPKNIFIGCFFFFKFFDEQRIILDRNMLAKNLAYTCPTDGHLRR